VVFENASRAFLLCALPLRRVDSAAYEFGA
jgi:hypothetical protein